MASLYEVKLLNLVQTEQNLTFANHELSLSEIKRCLFSHKMLAKLSI